MFTDNFRTIRLACEKNEIQLAVYSKYANNNKLSISDKDADELRSYQALCEYTLFTDVEKPNFLSVSKIEGLEDSLFPMILKAGNINESHVICYCKEAEVVAKQIVDGPAGQRQFIYHDGCHAIFIDVFKDRDNNISIITINSMKSGDRYTPENDIARVMFNNDKVKNGQLSMLNLQTDIQRSYTGCKYFSMAFAKQAAKDPYVIPQHQLNIAGAKSKMKNIRRVLGVKESERVLGAAYYKHSHSLSRIKKLPLEKREEIVSSKGSLLERHLQYRVSKIDDDRRITFSQSIDLFRMKQIKKAVK